MSKGVRGFLGLLAGAARDLTPIILVIAFFQVLVIRQPFPNLGETVAGLVFVVVGLAFFVQGLEMGLFPIGDALAHALARKGSLLTLLAFAFLLGFGTTVAEPALIAVTEEAASIAAEGGAIENSPAARRDYADGLRYTVALSVGAALVLGVFRILKAGRFDSRSVVGQPPGRDCTTGGRRYSPDPGRVGARWCVAPIHEG